MAWLCCARCYTCIITYMPRVSLHTRWHSSTRHCERPLAVHIKPSCISPSPSRVPDDVSLWTHMLEAIDGRRQTKGLHPPPIINTLRPRYLVPVHGNAANTLQIIIPLSQLPNTSPTHMHPSAHRSCTHQPHSAVAHTRTKLFSPVCMQMLSSVVVARLLGNQTSSHRHTSRYQL
jgi:hypothetical protein